MPDSFKIGDLVWAKMKGFPPWPGKVSVPPSDIATKKPKKPSSCIYFFGSKNYAWIEDNFIKPYQEHKETLEKSNKSVSFKEACAAIEDYIANRGENDEVENEPEPFLDEADALFNKIKEESNTPVAAEKPKPKPKSVKKEYNNTSRGSSKRLSENSSSADSVLNSIKKKKQKLQASSLKENSGADDRLSYSPKVGLLARPANTDLPETPSLDLTSINESLKDKNINPSSLKFGFLGLGIMGSGIVKNLLNSGHSVIVWNRSPEKDVIMPDSFKIGDLVWAKMKGFPPWPGKVSEACAAIEDYIANRGENDEVENEPEPFLDEADALFNKIKEESNTPVAAEKPKPKPKSVKKEYNNTSRGSSKRLSENSSSADSVLNSIKKKKQKLQASSLKENSGADDRLSYSPKVGLLARPANTDLPETPSLDLTSINESLKDKNINPSSLKFGFLGLGIMGSGIVKNLLNSGHSVIVWNRSPEKVSLFPFRSS
ncbi:hypothetical protein M8J76_011024 [Diaphorina citri]|nr:hypothetical protein M8J76_011024 [Diaphorina citri]